MSEGIVAIVTGASRGVGKGVALGLGPSPFQSQVRYYSQRAVEIFQIFEANT